MKHGGEKGIKEETERKCNSSFLPFSPPCFSSACFHILDQTSIQEKAKSGNEASVVVCIRVATTTCRQCRMSDGAASPIYCTWSEAA